MNNRPNVRPTVAGVADSGSSDQRPELGPAYLARLAAIAAELGIPSDYGPQRRLEPFEEAQHLVLAALAPDDGSEVLLTAEASQAWKAMSEAATRDNLSLWPLSGFRSVDRQTFLIRRRLNEGQTILEVLKSIAAPGYSEHHTGRALDIGSAEEHVLDEGFAGTPAFAWLSQKAGDFGWTLSFPKNNPHGIIYEPWHWCWGSVR